MNPEWWARRARIESPGRPKPWLVRVVRAVVRPLVRVLHRARLDGAEHLPAKGPYLLVANHSGGTATAEILSFVALYLEQVGADRPLAGFAHPAAFSLWPVSLLLRSVGAVPSTADAGAAALAAGVPLLVFPGGDHEGFRPIWQAHRVDFGGRKGFLRMARAARVPVVPMGIAGSHFTAPILWRTGAWLPRLLIVPWLGGLKRYPITVLGVAISACILWFVHASLGVRLLVVWAFLGTVVLPTAAWVPATIRMRIGPPIAPADLFGDGSEPAEGELVAALARVEGAVQALVDEARRRAPRGGTVDPVRP
jgi:1-acyl-sn-glycerol-3-phosphate acyltransferase